MGAIFLTSLFKEWSKIVMMLLIRIRTTHVYIIKGQIRVLH